MRLPRSRSSAAAAVMFICCVLMLAGCGASSAAPSSTSVGAGTGSSGSSTAGTDPGSSSTQGATSLSSPEQGGSLAEIPNTYVDGVPSRWVLYLHGYNQDAKTILEGDYGRVEAALLDAGYIVIGVTNTVQNCYGNAQCLHDIAGLVKLYQSRLSLQPKPFVLADSMGGFTALNAISAGVLQPQAVAGWCINTDLAWDYTSGGAAAPIAMDYNISRTVSYATATAGYDPMLQGGAAYATMPFELWGSYADTVVSRSENTDRFANLVNAAGGNVVVHTSSGEHLDSSNFDPAAIVAFFNAH